MDIFDLLLGNTGRALQVLFHLGFLPSEVEQYQQFRVKNGDAGEKFI